VARSYGRVFAAIWDDGEFRPLSRSAKCMYLFLLSQADMEHSGVIGLRVRRWARELGESDPSQVVADLKELDACRYVVVDEDTEELLVRSLIRCDEIWKQPNVFKAAATSGLAAKSRAVKAVLYEEMSRLDTSAAPAESQRVHAGFLAALEPFRNPSGTLRPSLPSPPGNPAASPVDPPHGARANGSGPPKSQTSKPAGRKGSGTPSEPHASPYAFSPKPYSFSQETGAGAVPPAAASLEPGQDPTPQQRAKPMTDAFYEIQPMCKWTAVNGIVIHALKTGRYADDDVRAALLRLAAEGRPVTIETLRVELEGLPATRQGVNGNHIPGTGAAAPLPNITDASQVKL
jgi:hypothetical protein